ncbi:MAG: universal stress protein [Mucilaginibacter sp.]|uniref:universal stress protein n=1 Tax=Mucilaginibacter sp. TaxID=1882438 RepID=UPI0032657CDF
MKTIAVLTDFSKRAENAARYALCLAEKIHADIKLYNSFFVPSEDPLSAQIAWPMEDYEALKRESLHQLELFGAKLKKEYSVGMTGTFKPAIEYECHDGNFNTYLKGLEAEKDTVLLVIGDHEKGMSTWMTGNHLDEIIDQVSLPVLVIGEHQKFQQIDKIAFATDLNTGDIEQIHSLAGLAGTFNAELLIVHIADEKYDDLELQYKVDTFLSDITSKIDFAKIYYRRVKSIDVGHGLNWISEHGQIDMLVMVHRHKTFLQNLFKSSFTKEVAATIHLPLLIFPSPAYAVPVF